MHVGSSFTRHEKACPVGVIVDVAGDGHHAVRSSDSAWGCFAAVSGTRRRSLDLGAEDGDAHAVGDADVTVGVREPTDQAVVAELAQVVGHLAGGVDAASSPAIRTRRFLLVEPVAAISVRHRASARVITR